MRATRVLAACCVALAGCGGVIEGTLPIEDTSWALVGDASNGLVDEEHPEFGAYPNPKALVRMEVRVRNDGRVCASDGTREWCGGPLQGIPYRTVMTVLRNKYCVRVMDMFGNHVRTGCEVGQPPPTLGPGVLASQMSQEDLPSGSGLLDEGSTPLPEAMAGTRLGAELVVTAINKGLEKVGLKVRVTVPGDKELGDFTLGPADIAVGQGTCADIKEYLISEFSDDKAGTDDYVFGSEAIKQCLEQGECRIGQLITRAMAEACSQIPEGTAQKSNVEAGIVGGGGHAVGELCEGASGEIDKCVGSPLVLDLAGDGLQLKGLSGGVSFALHGGAAMTVGWLAGSDDALLAIDLDGDGRISSGRELLGEASQGWAPNGFAALARHDANGDGVISPADPVFTRLLAWRDDGDGQSRAEELSSLSSLGIRSISLRSQVSQHVDHFGNQHGLVGSAVGQAGRQVPVIDVWFRMK